jgi:8-oxo-dGTP pyrophosphatase MutT (NUDIX family)
MKSAYTEIIYQNGLEITGSHKVIELPFKSVSARALIVRRRDCSILGTLHRKNGKFALPGGSINDGENPAQAVIRELREEKLTLINPDPSWENSLTVDYYDGYGELSVWYLILVEDVEIGECAENIETKWITQDKDDWYPYLHQMIILALCRLSPEMAKKTVAVK